MPDSREEEEAGIRPCGMPEETREAKKNNICKLPAAAAVCCWS